MPGSPLSNRLKQQFTGESIDYKQIIAFIAPIFVDQAFIILMSLLNTAMVSSSGVAAVSAVSMVDSLNIFIMNVFVAIATGGTVIVAQYKGSGDTGKLNAAASQAITAVAICATAIAVLVAVFHTPALNLLFGSAEADVLRGVSETKASLALSLIMNLTHFVLNIVLITLCDMGIVGLAISLITARVLGMVCALFYLIKINHTLRFRIREALKLHWPVLKKIMFIGVPFAAEQMFFSGGKLLTQTFIVQFGTLAITANAISNSISMLYQVGGMALSISIVTVVGQCIGSKHIADARKFIRLFQWLSSAFFVAVGVVLLSMWLFRIVLGYILGVWMGFGLVGVWSAMIAEWGIRGLVFYLRYRGDKWYKHKLI